MLTRKGSSATMNDGLLHFNSPIFYCPYIPQKTEPK